MDENNKTVEQTTAETALTAVEYSGVQTMWNNTGLYKMAVQSAKILASSGIVPENYRGKPGDCMIAVDMANRLNMSPLMVMQNLYVVKGKPAWSGAFCITLINNCGYFSPLEFIRLVNDKGELDGYYAQATDTRTGRICTGTPITWKMVKGEGWLDKNGSKWQTMPEQMFKYRAAAFFARTFCPEVMSGVQTVEEVKDVNGYDEPSKEKVVVSL